MNRKKIATLIPTRKNRDAQLVNAFALFADMSPADLLEKISAMQAELQRTGECKISNAAGREAQALLQKEQQLRDAIAAYEAAIAQAKQLLGETKQQANTTLASERAAAANERQEGKAILGHAADLRVLAAAVAANA